MGLRYGPRQKTKDKGQKGRGYHLPSISCAGTMNGSEIPEGKGPLEDRWPRRALLSVADKSGLVELGSRLANMGFQLIATGKTHASLTGAGLAVTRVSDLTGFPEILGGRVKTLHPALYAGILADPDEPGHEATLREHGLAPLDLVVVNLYPFEVAAQRQADLPELIEEIDIGGVTLLRAAAKNSDHVTVVCSPEDYQEVLGELEEQGRVTEPTRRRLALKAFHRVCDYDHAIGHTLAQRWGLEETFPETLRLHLPLAQGLRYGENPHQRAAFYRDPFATGLSVAHARQLQGKELSYNNLLDFDAAVKVISDFRRPTGVIIKHTNPCGVATADAPLIAYREALAIDSMAAFGGIVGLNVEVDEATAREITQSFKEGVIASSFTPQALEVFKSKPNMRLLAVDQLFEPVSGPSMVKISGGMLLQDHDRGLLDEKDIKYVTEREPTGEEWEALRYAWRLIKHIKSNSILFVVPYRTVGIGAGQMSRVDAVKIAAMKAGERARGAVMASDAFFPFRDGLDAAADAGVTAVIQPGGSIRDEQVIDAANERGLAMVFTGMRHFKH